MRGQAARLAFTLAEVLVTLGIIGIIAALTMPALITKYQKKQTVAQLKVVYSILNQAVELSVAENGEMQYWDLDLLSGFSRDFEEKYLLPYIKGISKSNNSEKVWKKLDGEYDNWASYEPSRVQYTLPNGCLMSFYRLYMLSSTNPANFDKTNLAIFVDLNGYKGPNRAGRDLFVFTIFPLAKDAQGKVMAGYIDQCGSGAKHYKLTRDDLTTKGCATCNSDYTGFGYGCAALIQKDGWEIKDDYPW